MFDLDSAAIVLVDFEDQPMASGAAQRFNDLFFSTGKIETKSVTEYYADVSGGKIAFNGEVFGPFRAPLKKSEYAHGFYGRGYESPNVQTLAADALAAAKSQISFDPYDNDGNGYVDAFIVVHAGSGAEVTGNTDDIWSVKWVLPDVTPVNNVNVYAFLTIPEDAVIGVSCHELGHLVFGWPDFYDTDDSSDGVGNWCLMSGGTWGGSPQGTRPCHPSAWCKANQGWVDVVTETTNRSVTLGDVKSSHEVHRLWTSGDTTSREYFLIENRQQAGFDQSLPGSGLLSMSSLALALADCSRLTAFPQSGTLTIISTITRRKRAQLMGTTGSAFCKPMVSISSPRIGQGEAMPETLFPAAP